jgi:hypothetical protein
LSWPTGGYYTWKGKKITKAAVSIGNSPTETQTGYLQNIRYENHDVEGHMYLAIFCDQ